MTSCKTIHKIMTTKKMAYIDIKLLSILHPVILSLSGPTMEIGNVLIKKTVKAIIPTSRTIDRMFTKIKSYSKMYSFFCLFFISFFIFKYFPFYFVTNQKIIFTSSLLWKKTLWSLKLMSLLVLLDYAKMSLRARKLLGEFEFYG